MAQRQANEKSKQQAAAQTAAAQKKVDEQLQLQQQEGIDTFQGRSPRAWMPGITLSSNLTTAGPGAIHEAAPA